MMTTLAQNHSPYPGGMQQHPGVPPHMGGVPHNPQQGQPGPGMPQMQMQVSGPGGPQVSQAGAMMGGMPPGAGVPSAHALQHLNPGQQAQQAQAQMFQQQQQIAYANNPQLQAQHQQQLMAHQRQQATARQAMMAQQYSGMPVGIPNGMNQMNAAQYAAMRGAPMRPVSLPQHLQQQQREVSHTAEMQQHQQQLMQQQMALQHQQAQGNNPGQQGQMGPQQMHNLQQAQMAAQQQQHHQQQQQAQAAAAAQQNQGQGQGQPPTSQPQANPQKPAQQPQGQPQPQPQPGMQQQAAAAAAMLQQQRPGEKIKGHCLMRLMQFADHLSGFGLRSKPLETYMANGIQSITAGRLKSRDDLNYWSSFVEQFFAPNGVLRHTVWIVEQNSDSSKMYEIPFPALPRYFNTHFDSGIKNMQMIMEKGSEKELPNNGHSIESSKSSFVYWFENGSQLIAHGTLRAHFDAEQKIELLEFATTSHEEYLPRTRVIAAARPLHEWQKEWHRVNLDGKQSPEMNKKKPKAMKSPPQPPPEIDLPDSLVKSNMGITPAVFRFLELAEVIGQMSPLLNYSQANPTLNPYSALEQYVAQVQVAANSNNPGGQPNPSGPRTPALPNFPLGASPAAAHLSLPEGSPHTIGGSPAQAPGMQLQQSQHGTSSNGPSANTSPNANNKRRRPSGVKEEDIQVNGTQTKPNVKPSPRITKRQKGNPA